MFRFIGLLSNQGEKSINFYFIRVSLRKNIKVWYSKAQFNPGQILMRRLWTPLESQPVSMRVGNAGDTSNVALFIAGLRNSRDPCRWVDSVR